MHALIPVATPDEPPMFARVAVMRVQTVAQGSMLGSPQACARSMRANRNADDKFGLFHSFAQRNYFRHLSTEHFVRDRTAARFRAWNSFRTQLYSPLKFNRGVNDPSMFVVPRSLRGKNRRTGQNNFTAFSARRLHVFFKPGIAETSETSYNSRLVRRTYPGRLCVGLL
jgi:hypothetical protein